jgi:RNA polymerase sporulation-specific sigma factor
MEKKINSIIKELETQGLTGVEEVNHINGSLYFVRTKDNAYTYDSVEQKIESCIIEIDADNNVESCKLTEEEKERFANENFKLIRYVIKGFPNINLDYDEMESIGYLGFAKALSSFDKMKGIRFSTFAINCISNEILFFLRKEKKHMGLLSINQEVLTDKEGASMKLEDTLEDTKMMDGVDADLLRAEGSNELLDVISQLKPVEQYVIMHKYGISGFDVMTQKQLARTLKMSQANVSKIQRDSLKRLNFLMKKKSRQGWKIGG